MRLAFMGTPDFAVPTLDALIAAGHEIAAVYTQPPRPAGRGKAATPSPVQRRAEEAAIEVRAPATLRDAAEQARFASLDLDAAIVAAYGLILPEPVLAAPRHGCLNVHASLLPRWRGAAPIQRAILAGDHVTGVTIMRMEEGLDTGPMLASAREPRRCKNAGELASQQAQIGAALLGETLARRIVETREQAGPYGDHDDLLRVRGIGPRTLEGMRPYLLPMPGQEDVAETGVPRASRVP